MMKKLNSCDIEIAVASHFNFRQNLIVPNVYWGLGFRHELDLIIVKSSNYAYEVEIKTSIVDLKAEKKKKHNHCDNRLRYLYFAVPDYLQEKSLELIPDRAGLLIVSEKLKVKLIKTPKVNKYAKKLTQEELIKLKELAAMRIWSLKKALLIQKKKNNNCNK